METHEAKSTIKTEDPKSYGKQEELKTNVELNEQQHQSILEAQQERVLTQEEEDKIVEAVIQDLLPIVEQLVSVEVGRVLFNRDIEDDGNGFISFPYIFEGSAPMFVSSHEGGIREIYHQQQQPINRVMETYTDGVLGDVAFVPSDLRTATMSGAIGGGVRGEVHTYSSSLPSPPEGLSGAPGLVEGFTMGIDRNQINGSQPDSQLPHYPSYH
ncbi:unnamed protein product [Rotaria sp. Silwood1]|nr:unnamed protein product [Rotaria sp. Silwood1]